MNLMHDHRLMAISPVDGRYGKTTEELTAFFSEYALIKYRVYIEIEYFIELCKIPLKELKDLNKKDFDALKKIHRDFNIGEALRIKVIEKITNHDVKAVEYFIKEKFNELGLEKYKEFVHFGLTSQDINNTAIPLSIKDGIFGYYLPKLVRIIEILKARAAEWKDIQMLSRTHGQPASPTYLGKEIMVFVERLEDQVLLLDEIPLQGKFGGASGNLNAHFATYPNIDWFSFANKFLKRLKLERQQYTTQIEHYDNLGAIFDNLKRINTILTDLCRDFWTYISMDYFKQDIKPGEVGSSAMPHKINPIDFENAEGNLGIANSLYEHLSGKLPVSRLQRDLTDSTVTRNIGVPVAHSLIALTSLEKGLKKLRLNKDKLREDLEGNWAVVAEAIQTMLRKINYPNPYEVLKELTRKNEKITRDAIHLFIDNLEISDEIKQQLKEINPFNYTGKYLPF
jgi:adenylosuccinate lyase